MMRPEWAIVAGFVALAYACWPIGALPLLLVGGWIGMDWWHARH